MQYSTPHYQGRDRLNGGIYDYPKRDNRDGTMNEAFNDTWDSGYAAGFAASRREAAFVIIMAAAFGLIGGLLAGMAITDFVL